MPMIAVAAVTAAATIYTTERARQDQKRAARIENKRRRAQSRREAQQKIGEAFFQRQDVVQGAANQGVLGASTVQGATGSIVSQMGSGLAFAEQNNQFITAANQRLAQAQQWGSLGNNIQAIGSAVMSAMSAGESGGSGTATGSAMGANTTMTSSGGRTFGSAG